MSLDCTQCNKQFNELNVMPCGDLACHSCIKEVRSLIKTSKTRFTCPFCADWHQIPETGEFPVFKSVMSMSIQREPTNIQRLSRLRTDVEMIEDKLAELGKSDRQRVDEFFVALKREVRLATERAVQQLNALGEGMCAEIDEYNGIYAKRLEEKTKAEMLAQHKEKLDVTQSAKFCACWKQRLADTQATIDDKEVIEAADEATNHKKLLAKHLRELNDLTSNYEKLQFIKNPQSLVSHSIGYLERKKSLRINLGDPDAAAEKEFSFIAHSNAVVALAALANDELASGSWDHTIRIWTVNTGKTRLVLNGHTDAVSALVSLSETELASGSWDETIRVWDVRKGVCKFTLADHTDCVSSLALLNGNKELASGCSDGTIRVWNLATRQCRLTLRGHEENMTVSSLVALANGDLASGSYDKTIKVWNTSNGTCKRTVNINDYINSMAIVSETEVAVGLSANDIQMWNIQTGEPRNVLTVEQQDNNDWNVKALMLLPNGDLASASSDKIIRIWNVRTGTLKTTLKGHAETVCALAVIDSLRLVSGSGDNTIKVWSYRMNSASGTRSEYVR